jgi:hypothetical protein
LFSRNFQTSYINSPFEQEPDWCEWGQGWKQHVGEIFQESGTVENQHLLQHPGGQLNPDRHEIRILEFLPGLKEQPIDCLLSTVSLDGEPMYEALSNVWGGPMPKKFIQLNKTEFAITPNLEIALLYLRGKEESRKL